MSTLNMARLRLRQTPSPPTFALHDALQLAMQVAPTPSDAWKPVEVDWNLAHMVRYEEANALFSATGFVEQSVASFALKFSTSASRLQDGRAHRALNSDAVNQVKDRVKGRILADSLIASHATF